MRSQKLSGRLLQLHEEIEDNAEDKLCDERNWNVDESQSECLSKGMVHSRLLVPMDDGSLSVQCRNFCHGREGSEEESAGRATSLATEHAQTANKGKLTRTIHHLERNTLMSNSLPSRKRCP